MTKNRTLRQQEIRALKAEKQALKAENKQLRQRRRSVSIHNGVQEVCHTIRYICKWGGWVWIAYWGYLATKALAGRETKADIFLGFLLDWDVLIGATAGVSGVVYGLRERKLKRDAVERLASRNKELERRLDPKRTSSNLTDRGETNPLDENGGRND